MSTPLERPDVCPPADEAACPHGGPGCGQCAAARADGSYIYTWPATGVRVELGRFTDKRGELRAEVTVARVLPGGDPELLYEGDFNLLSVTTRAQVVKHCAGQADPEIPWTKLFEHLCFLAKRRFRAGTPALHARDIVEDTRPRFALKPYVEYGRPTVVFGPGASAKTYLGIAAGVSWATCLPVFGEPTDDPLPVLYVDTETDARVWKRRVRAVLAGCGRGDDPDPDLFYRRLYGRLVDSADVLLREAKRLGVRYGILDSLGGAVGGELVDPACVLPCFDVLSRFEMPWLIISHVNAETVKNDGNGHLTPFGSIYVENASGNTFSVRNRSEPGQPVANLWVTHQKVNDGPKVPAHGLSVRFTNDPADPDRTAAVEFAKDDTLAATVFTDKQTLSDRIRFVIEQAPRRAASLHEIKEALPDVAEGSLRGTLSADAQRGRLVVLSRGIYGLASTRETA